MGVYADERPRDQFLAEYEATGKKLDMGASCVRFKRIGDLPLEVVGRTVAGMTMQEYIALVDMAQAGRKTREK